MKNSIKKALLTVRLTKEELEGLVERYHFQESELPHIGTLYEAALSLSEVQVHYRIWPEIQKGKRAALCVVTLGEGFDAMEEIYTEAQELMDVYILECIAAALLEKAYEQIEKMLWEETGLFVSTYEFPGTDMPLEQMRDILKEMSIQAEDLPVSCNEACMLQPKESVVFIAGLEKEKTDASICQNCPKTDCAYRREKKRVIDYFSLS